MQQAVPLNSSLILRRQRMQRSKSGATDLMLSENEASRILKPLRNRDSAPEFTLRGCEKIRSWFDGLTTSGVPQWKFKYLAARPEPVEGQRLIFSQLLSPTEGAQNDIRNQLHCSNVILNDVKDPRYLHLTHSRSFGLRFRMTSRRWPCVGPVQENQHHEQTG